MNESCHTYEWVMSHAWMSQVTRMNESRLDILYGESQSTHDSHVWMIPLYHIFAYIPHTQWVTLHTSIFFLVALINESRFTQERYVVTHIDRSCHTHEWVMSHTWMGHVTDMNESCHIRTATLCRSIHMYKYNCNTYNCNTPQHYACPYTCTHTTATPTTATHCNTMQIHIHVHIQLQHTATLCRSIYMYTFNFNTYNCHTLQHYADLYPLLIGLFLCIYGTFWICGSLLFTNFQIYRCDTIQITWITNVN